MTSNEAITCYERILAIMSEMREAASRAEWDRLVELEIGCKAVVTALETDYAAEPLSVALQQRKIAIIRQVLSLDAAIRDMTEPWLRHLQTFLGARQRERRLCEAYGTPDGA
jgi:flagellar protein FliT